MSDRSRPFRIELSASRPFASARWLWLAALLVPPVAAQDAPAPGAPHPVSGPTAPAAPDPDDGGDAQVDAADAADASEASVARAATKDRREQTARRLLHSVAGGVLRANSRWVKDHWEYERDGRWEPLPPAIVGSVRLESEALAEASLRKANARRGPPAARVDVATWMLDEGLLAEGIDLLDDVLRDEPDQPEVLALLADGDLPIALPPLDGDTAGDPQARAEFLRWAGRAPPALREMAAQRLSRIEADVEPDVPAALRADLEALLDSPASGDRAFAALALRRLLPPRECNQAEVETLMRRAVIDIAPEVRQQASLALRDNGEPAVILPVVACLASQNREVRTNAAESLGRMGYTQAVYPLVERLLAAPARDGGEWRPRANVFVGNQISYVAGFDVEVAQNAVIGKPLVGVIQEGATLDASVMGVSGGGGGYGGSGRPTEAQALVTALRRLTGEDAGNTKGAWKAWWEKNREKWFAGMAGQ